MIKVNQGQFIVNGKPEIIIAGEIHYFRLPKHLWKIHIEKLIDAGCNTVSTYIPWLIHEPVMDQYEFNGETLDQYDLISFIKLIQSYNLYMFFRPGPYVMAELYLEGIASYLLEIEDIFPVTFGKATVPNKQVDYLHPFFIERSKKHYKALFDAVYPYMQHQGGPIFGIQLDNEIGMLSWVSQSPGLTKDIVSSLEGYLDKESFQFYPNKIYEGQQKLGLLLREQFNTYVNILESHVKSLIGDQFIPFINIHGTSDGRGLTFPIGYSQLLNTFPGRVIGTDVYFGDLTLKNTHDFYIINSILNALKDPMTPATSLEFNAGNSNFGDDLSGHDMPQSMDKKIRFNMIQSHQMINYYLFSAGMNPETHESYQTGNRRIALTGERHGFSAPVKIDGSTTRMYEVISYANRLMHTHNDFLTSSKEVFSKLTLGLQLDQFMTESMRHGTPIESMKVDLMRNRTGILWDTFLKQALMLHVPFNTIHLESQESISPNEYPVLAIASATHMKASIQNLLVHYHKSGGKLILAGNLPMYDYDGSPCEILLNYFDIKAEQPTYDYESPLLSAFYDKPIEGYHSFRTYMLQEMEHNETSFFYTLDKKKTSFVTDRVIWITNNYPGHLEVTKRLLDHLDIKPIVNVTHDGFVYIFKTQSPQGAMLHFMNMETSDVIVTLSDFPIKQIHLKALDSMMIPVNMSIDDMFITASCEMSTYDESEITFRTEGLPQTIRIQTSSVISDSLCQKENDIYTCKLPKTTDTYFTLKKA